LGAAIRSRRLELGWSQEQLAFNVATCGDPTIRQSDVSRIERGKVELPRHARMCALAAALALPLGELLARAGWGGIETAIGTATAAAPPDPAPAVQAAVPETDMLDRVLPLPFRVIELSDQAQDTLDGVLRLREAIAWSQQTRAHTQHLLAGSRAMRESATSFQPLVPRLPWPASAALVPEADDHMF
jgi:transcriptional regulator with XRE-family HTH domain